MTVLVKRDITCGVNETGKDLQEADSIRKGPAESRTVLLLDFRKTTNSKEESVMKLVPLFDRVVLKQLIAEETTKSGIVLPGQAKEKPQQAEVIAVGPGGVVDGKEVSMQVKVGDKVIYSKYSGTEVEVEDEKYVVVKQNDILAVIE